MFNQWHVQTHIESRTHSFTFTYVLYASVTVHINLDTPSLERLHGTDNEAGEIPAALPFPQCGTLYSACIEHKDHRPQYCKHKCDRSLWVTHNQSLQNFRIRVLALFPCQCVLWLKSSRCF